MMRPLLNKIYWKIKLALNRLIFFRYFCIYQRFKNFTMLNMEYYIQNLRLAKRTAHLTGDVVECGVWRGGMSAGLGNLMPKRRYWLFDSFEGLPEAKEIDGNGALNYQANTKAENYLDNCRAEQAEAEKAMSLSKASDVHIVKGWFKESLKNFPSNEKIALLRLDGDWYESTMECLNQLYPQVVSGGIIIIDDYYTWDGCNKAVHDYLSKHQLPDRIFQFDNLIAYIVKT